MFIWQRRAAKVSLLIITTGWRQSHNIKIRHSDFNKPAVFLQKAGCVLSQWLLNPTFLSEVWLETPTRLRRQRWVHETQTHNDMLRISLVSGLHTPRSSCSKLEMRATPDPAKIKIDSGGKKWGQKSLCLVWLLLSQHGRLQGLTIVGKRRGQDQNNLLYIYFYSLLVDSFTVKKWFMCAPKIRHQRWIFHGTCAVHSCLNVAAVSCSSLSLAECRLTKQYLRLSSKAETIGQLINYWIDRRRNQRQQFNR